MRHTFRLRALPVSFALILVFAMPSVAAPAKGLEPRQDGLCCADCRAAYQRCAAGAGSDRDAMTACRKAYDACLRDCRLIYVIDFDARANDFREVHLVAAADLSKPISSWPFFPGFVFRRGDDIYLRVLNAKYDVELTASSSAAELAVPSLAPVYGADSIPKIVASFEPAIARFAGASVVLPQAGESIFLPEFLRALVEEPTKFREYLTSTVQGILEDPKIRDAADAQVSPLLAALIAEVGRILDGTGDPAIPGLRAHRDSLIGFKNELSSFKPTVENVYEGRSRFNALLRDRELISDRIAVSPLKTLADKLAALQQTFGAAGVRQALMLNPDEVSRVTKGLQDLSADTVAKWNAQTFRAAPPSSLIQLLKDSRAYDDKTFVTALPRLQVNVPIAVQFRTQLRQMSVMLQALIGNNKLLSRYQEPETKNNLANLTDTIREVNEVTAVLATGINDFPSRVAHSPLQLRVGQWFDNKAVTLTVGTRKRLRDYNVQNLLSALKPVGEQTPVGSGAPAQPPLLQEDFKTVKVTNIEVHQLYHFRLSGGFTYSRLRDEDFTVATRTVPDPAGGVNADGTPKTRQEKFLLQTKNRPYHFFPSLNLVYYPKARDFYPGRARSTALGVLAGFSLVNPRKDFLFGANVEFSTMAAVYTGLHLGYVPTRPADIHPNDAIPESRVVVIEEKLHPGYFLGVNFDLAFFKQVFSGLFGF